MHPPHDSAEDPSRRIIEMSIQQNAFWGKKVCDFIFLNLHTHTHARRFLYFSYAFIV